MPDLDDFTLPEEALGGSGTPPAAGAGDDEQTLVTKEGLKKLQDEVEMLKTVRRQEVAQRLNISRTTVYRMLEGEELG